MKKILLSLLVALLSLVWNPVHSKNVANARNSVELAPSQSRKKTVHVRSYTRKNGTTVRSHYRSRARR